MKPLVIGTREDVAGFALAGVEGVVCTTAEEASRAIERAGEDTLVILSRGVAPASGRPLGGGPAGGRRYTVTLP